MTQENLLNNIFYFVAFHMLYLLIFNNVFTYVIGLALRCWDCASNNNVLCADPLNITDHQAAFYTKLCETGSYEPVKHVCRKIVRRGKWFDE